MLSTILHALYGNARILNGVTFSVDAAERVALVGRNGVGKTTVVNTLCGMTRVSQGRVEVRGKPVADLRGYTGGAKRDLDRAAGKRDSPQLDGRGGIAARGGNAPSGPWSLARVQELFPILAERRHNPGLALSGGQQQMLAIGRALMANPDLLILDEPSEGLAPSLSTNSLRFWFASARTVWNLLIEQNISLIHRVAERFHVAL